MTSFLERAALHQTRFRTPGVHPDARGVVLGQKGLVLFPSLDRVVAFFRAYGDEGSLDEILPSLVIQRVVSALKTREIVVTLAAESSYRMDRVAAVARLAGGDVFTGTQRHFVKYRDATSPLGYDIAEVVEAKADLVVHHDAYRQAYNVEREVPFRDLVLKLSPYRLPPTERSSANRFFATAETGIGHALVGYLFRWRSKARVAIAEWPSASAFDERPRRLHLFDIEDAAPRIVTLLRSLPGVTVFEPLGRSFGVELGFKHPISLESCQSLFPESTLTLFRGDGQVVSVDPLPPFAPVRTLVRTPMSVDGATEAQAAEGIGTTESVTVPLRLAPTIQPARNVLATVIPASQREFLAKLLYVMPPRALESVQLAVGRESLYLVDPNGVDGVPLGRFFCEVAHRIYVPTGMTLVPAVQPAVLEDMLASQRGNHIFFEADGAPPRVVPSQAFSPLSRSILRELAGVVVHADMPGREDPALPLLSYGPELRFPLWGAPGREETNADPALKLGSGGSR
ncbi:MAG: hypothetical protein K1X94_05285 [Sandaracinaceae bacterium]|nr:hypothetical protein [Sandaracinaceae bacterium]